MCHHPLPSSTTEHVQGLCHAAPSSELVACITIHHAMAGHASIYHPPRPTANPMASSLALVAAHSPWTAAEHSQALAESRGPCCIYTSPTQQHGSPPPRTARWRPSLADSNNPSTTSSLSAILCSSFCRKREEVVEEVDDAVKESAAIGISRRTVDHPVDRPQQQQIGRSVRSTDVHNMHRGVAIDRRRRAVDRPVDRLKVPNSRSGTVNRCLRSVDRPVDRQSGRAVC